MSEQNLNVNAPLRRDHSLTRASDRPRYGETPAYRRDNSRPSRSGTRRTDDTPRRRRSRSPGRTRSRHRSRQRRGTPSSLQSLQQRERKLSRESDKLLALENEVRKEPERLKKRDIVREESLTPRLRTCKGYREATRVRGSYDRQLNTPIKRRLCNDDETESVLKKPGATVDFFEEFLNVLKSKAGDRESFPNSTLNNVIPEFDPMLREQTINTWLDKVDECTEIYNWSDKQTIHYALPKLTGLAKTWYQGLPSIKHTWLEWKTMLRESFPAIENYAELLTDMLNRRVRAGESFELYYFAKINLMNRCKIFGKQAVDCLLYGIDDSEND